jgi:alpha-glucosidase (family GH31 glycosyl hydrolase)
VPSPIDQNEYGSHPFYLDLRQATGAHGVFLKNSNGMDVQVSPSSLTYRTIGGVLDFYFFAGPSPAQVAAQYQEVVGKPHMPPLWALGWHQCRYGRDIRHSIASSLNRSLTIITLMNRLLAN